MSTPLPPADQPDPYTGQWTRAHIHKVSPDTHHGIYHLGVGDGSTGSYCTEFNPRWWCDLTSTQSPTVSVGRIIQGRAQVRIHGHQLQPCPQCLTMARVQAEMTGQRYPVRRLLDALDRLPVPPAPTQSL